MMHKLRLLILSMVMLCPFLGQAQQQPQFSHYGFNGQFISPGYSGIKGQTELNVLYRYQWLGYDGTFDAGGAPRTALFTASMPVAALRGGLGLVVVKDEIGAVDIFQAQLSYSQHVRLGGGTLGIGVQGGFMNMSKGGYRPNVESDPRVPLNSSDGKFDIGVGLWYEHERWYVGGGIINLLGATYEFENAQRSDTLSTVTGEKHLTLTGGYNFELSTSVTVTPTVIYKYDAYAGVSSVEVGGRATFNNKFWGGLGYRTEEALTGMLGVYMLKDNALSFGYAFDYTISDAAAKSATSHEIMLGYRLPKSKNTSKPIIKSPRYNF